MHLNRKNGSRSSLAMQLVGTLLARKSVFIVHCISQVLIVCRLRTAFLMHRAKIEKNNETPQNALQEISFLMKLYDSLLLCL